MGLLLPMAQQYLGLRSIKPCSYNIHIEIGIIKFFFFHESNLAGASSVLINMSSLLFCLFVSLIYF